MRKLFLLFLVLGLLLAQSSRAQSVPAARPADHAVSGSWAVTADFYGTPMSLSLELVQEGGKLTGTLNRDNLEGSLSGNSIHFLVKDKRGNIQECTATIHGDTLSGTIIFTKGDDPAHPDTHPFTATLLPQRRAGAPQRFEFVPTIFYRQYSSLNKPVLTILPGDTVHTTTVDAGGTDYQGVTRAFGGNPATGPFYIATAAPGDTLVVHFTRVRLNRDWAASDDSIVPRALDSHLAAKMEGAKPVRWHLDLQHGVATPEKPAEHLTRYDIPVRPMLGCVAVAPDSTQAAPDTRDSGRWGGNMDFNEIVEGATVYLPVSVPGALLYMGDGHAVQGDGELTGDALETSMDVEFTVDVISKERITGPRVESATQIMAMGLQGSLDEAFRAATTNMAQWLIDKYKLTLSEVAQVLGTAAEYKVSEAADRNAGVVLKINKERLQSLTPAAK